MGKVLEIFTTLFSPFFNNGKSWITARKLTIDDFDVVEIEAIKDSILKSYLSGFGDYFRITVQVRMKESTIKMLDKMEYFTSRGKRTFDELSEREKTDLTVFHREITLNIKKRCQTAGGGRLRNEEKISRIIDEVIVEGRKKFETEKEVLIQNILDSIDQHIHNLVNENNRGYMKSVVPVFTERKTLDGILNANSESEAVSKLKIEHDVGVGKLDAEIDVYKKKIAELEAKKTEVYISTRNTFVGKRVDELPDEVKTEIDSKTPYPNQERGFFI